LWLVSFFASSETESAAQPGRALGFYTEIVVPSIITPLAIFQA